MMMQTNAVAGDTDNDNNNLQTTHFKIKNKLKFRR